MKKINGDIIMSILKKKSSSPKYELLSVDKRYKFSSNIEDKLHQIRNIKTGELGGFIESESNLSQQGKCWIDIVLFIDEDKSDRYYWEKTFEELGIKFDRENLPKDYIQIYKLTYHLRWKKD